MFFAPRRTYKPNFQKVSTNSENTNRHVAICADKTQFQIIWTETMWFLQVIHPTDPPGQLDVSGKHSNPLGVDGTQVGVWE